MREEEHCTNEKCLKSRLLGSALTGVIMGEINYGGGNIESRIYLTKELINYHTKYPISTSSNVIEDLQDKLKNLTNERAIAMGIRNRVEPVTSKGLEPTNGEA